MKRHHHQGKHLILCFCVKRHNFASNKPAQAAPCCPSPLGACEGQTAMVWAMCLSRVARSRCVCCDTFNREVCTPPREKPSGGQFPVFLRLSVPKLNFDLIHGGLVTRDSGPCSTQTTSVKCDQGLVGDGRVTWLCSGSATLPLSPNQSPGMPVTLV